MTFALLAISDRRALRGSSASAWAAAMVAAGVPAVQLREKDLSDAACHELARLVRAVAPPPLSLLVNGRADIALACGGDGVHLPADGVPIAAVRQRWGQRLIVGRSTHDAAEVAAAAAAGADYVTFGPVFASPGKGDGVGLDALARVTRLGVPVLALGGVAADQIAALAAAGAAGVAGISAFHDLERLPELVARAREAFA